MENKQWIEIKVEKKDTDTKDTGSMKLTYTAWQTAWKLLMQTYPQAVITTITRQDADGNVFEFHGNESIGYCVYVRLQIKEIGFDFTERLAILDNANNPQKIADYEFTNSKGRLVKVAGLCIDDICNTIQRCTVKVIARAGIGLNVYEGDFSDIKSEYNVSKQTPKEPAKQTVQQPVVQNKITIEQRDELQKLIADAEKEIVTICNYFKVSALSELTTEQYKVVKQKCEKAINDMN